ncbi:hypothetical protein SUGI_0092470 [Cryptomeria japonica]|nr:hypothetical protein SUGI_0092470 [Cryptomeria japonica]
MHQDSGGLVASKKRQWPRCIKEAVSLTLGYVGSVNVDLMSGWVNLKSLGFTSVRFSAEYLVLKAIFSYVLGHQFFCDFISSFSG